MVNQKMISSKRSGKKQSRQQSSIQRSFGTESQKEAVLEAKQHFQFLNDELMVENMSLKEQVQTLQRQLE